MSITREVLLLLLLFAPCLKASAAYSKWFTPADLTLDSDVILVLAFSDVKETGKTIGAVKRVLRGKYEGRTIELNLAGMPEADRKAVGKWIAEGKRQAVFFSGTFSEEAGLGKDVTALLHIAGEWVTCSRAGDNIWHMKKTEPSLRQTWWGGTNMLLRCVEYILSTPRADLSYQAGASWMKAIMVGKMSEGVTHAIAINATGQTGRSDLFVASRGGDRVFRWNGKAFEDVTTQHALKSRSMTFAWADFNRDGRIDLASWDGKALRLHLQKTDGTFVARACDTGGALKDGCLALAVVDSGQKGKPALLVSTRASPIIMVPQEDGSVKARALVASEFSDKGLGKASKCLVADMDGDDIPDILQLFSRGSMFYRGRSPFSTFENPVKRKPCTGEGMHDACLGDYDADGLLDIFVGGKKRNRLWHNLGSGKFAEVLNESGEIQEAKPGAACVHTGDINTDGIQDILIAYAAERAPSVFFNRGFRSFGYAKYLDIKKEKLLPVSPDRGQQTACLGDFNSDGAPDMALVLHDGTVWIIPRRARGLEGRDSTVTAVFSLASRYSGPVRVCAWGDDRPLGAHVLRAGRPGSLTGLYPHEFLTLRWRIPGETMREKKVRPNDDGPVHVILDKLIKVKNTNPQDIKVKLPVKQE